MNNEEPLWTPTPERAAATQMRAFARHVGRKEDDSGALHEWSVNQPDVFWSALWDFAEVIGTKGGDGGGHDDEGASEGDGAVLIDAERMPGARWFPNARLNFAENLLRRNDDGAALVFVGEDGRRREWSHATLRQNVARLAYALAGHGVRPGDRVAGYLPNLPEAVSAMLAATSLGAVWSSCSPDFGVRGVLDRFGQIEPRVLICADAYVYGGRRFDSLEKLPEILRELPSVEHVIVVPYTAESPDLSALSALSAPAAVSASTGPAPTVWLLDDFVEGAPDSAIAFAPLPFDHPVYILYSSGTTGKPKCIVHGAGGTLLQHLKEQRLHVDLRRDERLFYFTTCGWMMWNWLVSGLASEATLVLYDGSPFHPTGARLFELAERERVDVFGVSAKFIDAVAKSGLEPGRDFALESVRTILSTGSPLLPESFDFVYEKVKADVQLASISGGTDIVSCFVLGDPTSPVWRGEIQMRGLGMRVEVFDANGRAVDPESGEAGELVCTAPFPSMPVGFWRDPGQERYRAAYFDRFPGAWCHGDFICPTPRGGFVIRGRSDAVLNPGGVRIGTAEIYRPVERMDEVLEGLAIGQEWDGDVRVVLFVTLAEGRVLDDELTARIQRAVRENASPRHTPARVVQVPDLPRTRSGKITELAVREIVHGRPVKNVEALANPEALEHFRNRAELAS